jgi:hypothetical protein
MKTDMALNFGKSCDRSLYGVFFHQNKDQSLGEDSGDDKNVFNANIALRIFKEETTKQVNWKIEQEIKHRNHVRMAKIYAKEQKEIKKQLGTFNLDCNT